MNKGFNNPEIHGVTRLFALTFPLEGGAYVGLSFVQGDEGAIIPECQIFGGPEMADKFERLAEAVNDIFDGMYIEPEQSK